MTPIGHHSTSMKISKSQMQVMLTEMSIRARIQKLEDKDSITLLDELNLLHECQALLPKKKEDILF